MSAMARSKPLLSISVAMKATLRLKRSSFATSEVALRLLAGAIAAASCGRSLRLRLRRIPRSARRGGLRYSAARPRAAPRIGSRPARGRNPQIADITLAYYEFRYRQRHIVGAVIYAAEESHVLLDDREN